MSVETMISASHLSAIETLGTRLENTSTAEEAMKQGLLGGWNVRKWPAVATDPDTGRKIPKPGMYDLVRDNPFKKGQVDVLSRYSVGEGYAIVQNEDHAEFLNVLVDESGANFELAGAADDGRKVFISMRLPGHIMIGGVDQVDISLLAINAHDGSMSFTLAPMPVRFACGNVLNCVHGGRSGLIRVRHTSGAKKNMVAQAREALDLSFQYLDDAKDDFEKLIQTAMTQARFEAIIEKEFGVGEDASKAATTRADKKIEEITSLFADAQTQANIRDTAWAGYNALTEWADHFSPTRGSDREASRAQKAILDPSFKTRALQLMLAEV